MTLRAILSAAAILIAGGVHADELRPIEAVGIDIGSISGVAYYTVEGDGFQVVATLADEQGSPFRVEATLADDQTILLSVPGALGEPGAAMAIARHGDAVSVSPAPAQTN